MTPHDPERSIAQTGRSAETDALTGMKQGEPDMNRLTPIAIALMTSVSGGAAAAEEFRWAGTTDPQTMDPHAELSRFWAF